MTNTNLATNIIDNLSTFVCSSLFVFKVFILYNFFSSIGKGVTTLNFASQAKKKERKNNSLYKSFIFFKETAFHVEELCTLALSDG